MTGNKLHKSWDNTVLGHLKIEDGTLKVTVNSGRRARRIRKEIEKRLGGSASLVDDEISSLEEALTKEETPKDVLERARAEEENARNQSLPEVQAIMKEFSVTRP